MNVTIQLGRLAAYLRGLGYQPYASGSPVFIATWNAATNIPALASGVGPSRGAGGYYLVSVAGSTSLDGISTWSVGDWAIWNGTAWQKLNGSASESFNSVTVTSLTAGRVTFASTGGLLIDSASLTFDSGTGILTSGGMTTTRTSGVDANIVQGNLTGTNLFAHAYEDKTSFTSVTTGAYASYDTLATMSGALAYNHFIGYEARNTYSGSISLTTFEGFYSGIVNSGTGVNAIRHFAMQDSGGSSTEQTGLYIPDLTSGTNRYGVYSAVSSGANKFNIYAIGTAPNYFNGQVQINAGMQLAASTVISSLGSTRINFATNTNIVLSGAGSFPQISSLNDAGNAFNPLAINATTSIFSGSVRLKGYTVATLPGGPSQGDCVFVTDASGPTFNATVAGGGSVVVRVMYDGSAWKVF